MKRVLSFLLVLILTIGLIPVQVLASENEANPWEGRSAVFVGDSITAGSGTTKIYYEYLKESLGFGSVTSMGIAGSCISAASDYNQSNQPLINRYQDIPAADFIMIFMGTNDYGHETPLGSLEDTQDGTFYGALNVIIPALVTMHPSSKIVFVTPMHRYGFGTSKILETPFTSDDVANGVGAALCDYVDALKTVCANYGVSVIDLYTECSLDPADASVRSAYIPDGLHPNAAGHELVAGIMESHIRNWEPVDKVPETETEPEEETELIYGNKFASGFAQQNRASARVNQYLKAGTVITLKNPEVFQWASVKTSGEHSTNNLGYFPDSAWSDKETGVVAADGWVGFVFKYRDETQIFDLTTPLSDYITIEEPHTHSYATTITAPTCAEQGYTTYTCACGESYVDNYVDATGEHSYENGTCTSCGAEEPINAKPMSMRYDDHLDTSGKVVEIIDAGTPTSYQVGYGVEENKFLDTAVVTLKGNTLVATGIGTALVKIDGENYEITVTAAPISLLLLIGQSNMRGSEGNADQSIVCPDGMVYATFGDDRGDAEGIMNVNNATNFAASALTGAYSTINVNGTTDNLSYYPINALTEAGDGTFGPDSGFAYEWVKQTGEKVWVVNAAHGGSSITSWQPNATNFKEAVLLFAACQETLRKEIAAGHFTLSHMGYFWCQGCSDYNWIAEKYVTNYLTMHNGLKSSLAFDHDSSSATDSVIFEFAGIIPVRAGHDYNDGYREDVYTDTTSNRFYESFMDLQMTGPRVAQYWMCNNPELEDIWLVCNAGEDWVWMPDGTNGVSAYFQSHYANDTVDYQTQVAQKASWYTPTTPAAVHDSIHYNQIGYNEIGRESVRNALIMLGKIQAPQVETTVELLSWDGYTPVNKINASLSGNSDTLVVPKVYPVWKSKEVSYTLTEGFNWSYYDVLTNNEGLSGTLTMGGQTVTIEGHNWSEWETLYEASAAGPGKEERVCSHCDKVETREIDGVWQIYKLADHLLELPEDVCCDTNLWAILPHEDVHFTSGKTWGKTGTHTTSITIPVNPGDKLYATSWKKAGENGHETSNGIRVTFFDAKGIAKTMGPGQSDREFYANGGYLIAPEGTIAINIVMWYDSEDYEVYILNREHDYKNGTCAGCGDHKGAIITQQPESVEQEIGKKFAITVKAEGEGLTYQWYVKEAGAKAFKVSSNKTSSYAYTMQTYMHNRQIYCVITDTNGYQVTTETTTITRPPESVRITEQPSDVSVAMGETFSINVKAEGEGLTYQWYYKNASGKSFAASSIKKSSYSSKMVSYMVGRQVYCVITDKYGNSVTSDVATIKLPDVELKILTQPEDVYAPLGQKFSVAPEVQGEGLTYQWYYKNAGGKSFAASSNKTAAYAYSMQSYMNGRSIYCVITDRYGNQVTTETVTIYVVK